jgi:CheY-like chemotaxis protein
MTSVLVLDDRPVDRELMTTLLGYAGHTVIEAVSGEAALELVREQRPGLIITDIMMPGMNGYEFVRRLREDPDVGGTTVIFCTATYLERGSASSRRLAG